MKKMCTDRLCRYFCSVPTLPVECIVILLPLVNVYTTQANVRLVTWSIMMKARRKNEFSSIQPSKTKFSFSSLSSSCKIKSVSLHELSSLAKVIEKRRGKSSCTIRIEEIS